MTYLTQEELDARLASADALYTKAQEAHAATTATLKAVTATLSPLVAAAVRSDDPATLAAQVVERFRWRTDTAEGNKKAAEHWTAKATAAENELAAARASLAQLREIATTEQNRLERELAAMKAAHNRAIEGWRVDIARAENDRDEMREERDAARAEAARLRRILNDAELTAEYYAERDALVSGEGGSE
jgi:hypothetical protein